MKEPKMPSAKEMKDSIADRQIKKETPLNIDGSWFDSSKVDPKEDYQVNYAPASSPLVKGSEVIKELEEGKIVWAPYGVEGSDMDDNAGIDLCEIGMLDEKEIEAMSKAKKTYTNRYEKQ